MVQQWLLFSALRLCPLGRKATRQLWVNPQQTNSWIDLGTSLPVSCIFKESIYWFTMFTLVCFDSLWDRWWSSCCSEVHFWRCGLWTQLHQCCLCGCKLPSACKYIAHNNISWWALVGDNNCCSFLLHIWHSGLFSKEEVHCHSRWAV